MEESYEDRGFDYRMTTMWMTTTLHFADSHAGDIQYKVFDAAAAAEAEAGGGFDCENRWQHVHSPVCIISMLRRSSHSLLESHSS